MTIVSGFTDSTPGGDATTPKTGDLSSAITAGSTNADIRITNTGESPCSFNWRDTGTTAFYQKSLLPLESVDIKIALTAARTFEYHFDASTLQVDVAYFFGTGALPTTVTVSDIRTTLLGGGYSTNDIPDATISDILSQINEEVTDAANRHASIAMFTLNGAIKINAIKMGAGWLTLMELHNKGVSRGLESNAPRVSLQTAKDYQDRYEGMITRIRSGIVYGA